MNKRPTLTLAIVFVVGAFGSCAAPHLVKLAKAAPLALTAAVAASAAYDCGEKGQGVCHQ